jgi:hypothetical protein
MVMYHDKGNCGLRPCQFVKYERIRARCFGASKGFLSVMINSHDVAFTQVEHRASVSWYFGPNKILTTIILHQQRLP